MFFMFKEATEQKKNRLNVIQYFKKINIFSLPIIELVGVFASAPASSRIARGRQLIEYTIGRSFSINVLGKFFVICLKATGGQSQKPRRNFYCTASRNVFSLGVFSSSSSSSFFCFPTSQPIHSDQTSRRRIVMWMPFGRSERNNGHRAAQPSYVGDQKEQQQQQQNKSEEVPSVPANVLLWRDRLRPQRAKKEE